MEVISCVRRMKRFEYNSVEMHKNTDMLKKNLGLILGTGDKLLNLHFTRFLY
jgi:hypothetical protein